MIDLFELPYYKAAREYIWTEYTEQTTAIFNFYYKELETALIVCGVDSPTISDIMGCEDGSAYLEELPQDKLNQVLLLISTN